MKIAGAISSLPSGSFFLDARGRSAEWAARQASSLVKNEGIDLVFFDYLQSFNREKAQADRRLEVTYISRVFTDCLKINDTAGAILSQITPQLPGQGPRIPDAYSLRDSKDVANAADVVAIGFFSETPVERFVDGRNITVAEKNERCMVLAKNKPGPGPGGRIYRMGSDANHGCFDVVKNPEPNNDHWADDLAAPLTPPPWERS